MAAGVQSFQSVNVSGNARVHLGNSIRNDSSDGHSNSQRLRKSLLNPSTLCEDRLEAIGRTKRREAVDGSGEWLLGEPALKSWLVREYPLLWVLGKPGSGKTFLAHHLITHLRDLAQQDSTDLVLAYYFFQRGSEQSESVHQALKDIIFQISQQDAAYADYLENHDLDSTDISTLQGAWRIFFAAHQATIGGHKQVLIVLDGLDEADTTQSLMLLELMRDLSTGDGINVVIFSRPGSFGLLEFCMLKLVIHVDAGKNGEDISRYCGAAIGRSRKLSRLSTDLQTRIVRAANANSQGMFLYAKVLVGDLESKQRISGIEQALQMPPMGLANLFEEVVRNLTSTMTVEDISDLDHILMWVAHARRLLSLGEIDSMLRLKSLSADDPVLDLEHKLRFQFGSLFDLVREDGLTTSDLQLRRHEHPELFASRHLPDVTSAATLITEADSTLDSNPATTLVVFSHSSLFDFFARNGGSVPHDGRRYPLGLAATFSKAQIAIFQVCFRILQDSFLHPNQSSPELFAYASHEWMAHALACAKFLHGFDEDEQASLGLAIIDLLTRREMLDDPSGWLQKASTSYWQISNAERLLPLLNNEVVRKWLPASTSQWLDGILPDPIVLFEPALQTIARQWLTYEHTKLKPKDCAMHLHTYQSRKLGLSVGGRNDGILNPDAVEAAAEWAMLPRTSQWRWRVMECLWHFGHPDAALKHLKMFIEEYPAWPPALLYMGRIFQKQQSFHIAMDYFAQATALASGHSLMPREMRDVTIRNAKEGQAQCAESLAEALAVSNDPQELSLRAQLKYKSAIYYSMCFRTLGDHHYFCAKAILHLCDIAWDLHLMPMLDVGRSPMDISLSDSSVLDLLPSATACYQLVMDILGELHEAQLPSQEIDPRRIKVKRSHLLVCLADNAKPGDHFTRCIAFAAQRTGRLSWLVERYRDAIALAEITLQHMSAIWLMNCLAVLLDDYGRCTEGAIKVWRDIIEHKAPATIKDSQNLGAWSFAEERLARAYAKVNLIPPDRLAISLDHTSTKTITSPRIVLHPDLHISVRLHNIRKLTEGTIANDKSAKIILAEFLAQNAPLDCKTDRVLWFGRLLVLTGDFENAAAAYSVYHEYVDGFALSSTHRRSMSVLPAGMAEDTSRKSSQLIVCCDGPCRRRFMNWEGIVTCHTCINVDYCQDCFDLLQAGELGMTSCTTEHAFWQVPILPEGVRFREGEVAVGDRILSVEEWVTGLRKQYCFSNNQSKDNELRGDAS